MEWLAALGLTTILREKDATLFSAAGRELVTADCWVATSLGGDGGEFNGEASKGA